MKILMLTRFGSQGASSRIRSFQLLPWLKSNKIEFVVSPLFNDEMLLHKYFYGKYGTLSVLKTYLIRIFTLIKANNFDLIWIEKEALPWLPAKFERWLLHRVPYVLDFDDAIFHKYDLHRYELVRRVFGERIDFLMSGAKIVVAGNRYLLNRSISSGAKKSVLIPTVVDMKRYSVKRDYANTIPVIVWIGSPSTTQYLFDLVEPLKALASCQPFKLRIIGGGVIHIHGIDIESVAWSADIEAEAIAACDIGIMPLRDTPWEQGKCAYKLIQYMACGLPTVSSPIGANLDVVVKDVTGFFADTPSEWVAKLELLLCDQLLRQRMGQAGRIRVEEEYSLHIVAPKLISLLVDSTNE